MNGPREFSWPAFRSWENKTEAAAYDDPLARCKKFPDHDCEFCHAHHIETNDFNPFCSICIETKCPNCDGTGWMKDGAECAVCKSTGRI